MPEFELNGIHLNVPRGVAGPKIFDRIRDGRYEANEARCAMERVAPGDRVLEIGSGIGYVTALCAKRAGPARVTGIEANPDLLPIIEENLARNGLSGVNLLHGAVAGGVDGDETVSFNIGPIFWGSSLLETPANVKRQVEVPLLDIHKLLDDLRPNVVIMDVEGAEASMFSEPWPDYVHTVCLELHPKLYLEGTIRGIFDRLREIDLGYDPHVSMRDVICLTKDRGF
ncbi:MAG: FkbM family methyltransferase [Pseudomonadota bacterium]